MFFRLIIILFLYGFLYDTECSPQGEQVDKWTEAIGHDLRLLGQTITRYSEIQQKYKFLNAKVEEKNPYTILAEIKETLSNMINTKVAAITRIQETAENAAYHFEFNRSTPFKYYSSKWSSFFRGNTRINVTIPKSLRPNKHMYLDMQVYNDTHFYNLSVNTTNSSVHVPTNVNDREEAAAFAIQWSQALDDVFVSNYNMDPALSWQYFGSTSGIMRHYPGKPWEERKQDLFDCRIRTWFIEAATCTKDAVILMDNSGSMTGMGHHIGSLTASSILNTFSNNDRINVLNYSATTNYTIPCFANKLVQATRENIEIFKSAIDKLKPEGKTRLDQALEVAFELLAEYRRERGCVSRSSNCNQAIMIITDGVNGNLSDTIIKYNYLNNGSNIPVRIFTYLVGKEVANVEEIKWISCANRGYYARVQTLEQVTASVVHYISVIARPLVLQASEHPVSWTHAYVDLTYDDANDEIINEPYRLLTSAAIPCYDTKTNNQTDAVTAYLLGVAGTDVPLDEFTKLMVPYKVGVNGYAFIVSNNGYVLMHPDLRPVGEDILKENYNSVDLTQVEQHDDELPARGIGETLSKLRQALVDGKEGSIHNIKLSYHYDKMKRVAQEYYDYYYTPLEHTPFTMCIALPRAHGNYSLEVGDKIQMNKHTGENFTTFFNGKWKIHPKWVYCRYHYLEDHEFDTPENELIHFLNKMYDGDFKWEGQYETDNKSKSECKNKTESDDCGKKLLGVDSYYCDRQLIQRLIFDAEITNFFYSQEMKFNEREMALFERFNASLRFVATMSGLTRWDYIFEVPKRNTTSKRKEFGDLFPRAINEKWYKSAVLQHKNDSEAFVYSVPFDTGENGDSIVTGSYAIFPSDGGHEAPGSVVGFQFSQRKLRDKVWEISNKLSNQCAHCLKCNGSLICYVVDSSGYIIASLDNDMHTGKFFGEVEGDILKSMLEEEIFKQVTVFDYQALCSVNKTANSGTSSILTPLAYMETLIHWIFFKMVYLVTQFNIYDSFSPLTVYAQDMYNDSDAAANDDYAQNLSDDLDAINNEDYDTDSTDTDPSEYEIVNQKKNDFYACETEITLFVLQQDLFIKENNFFGEIDKDGVRYYVKRIPFSNLIFVAIDPSSKRNDGHIFTTVPKPITEKPVFEFHRMNTTLLPCQKLDLNSLPRRRLAGCYNEHDLERYIMDCGRANPYIKINFLLFLLCLSIRFTM